MGTLRLPICIPEELMGPTAPMKDDILEDLHARREAYAARFEYDLDRIFEDLKAKEAANPAPRADVQPVNPRHS